jgi:antitoxin (DNA-binding transcriptional repressor) of toxin-antitoxin stability system
MWVKNGDVVEVTEHGRVIATITPSSAEATEAERPRPRAGGGMIRE